MLNDPPFGGQTVALVTVSQTGQPGWGGLRATTRTPVRLEGCHFRPYSSSETPERQIDVTTEVWKLTAPPEAAALAVKASGQLIYDGTDHPELIDLDSEFGKSSTFQIYGQIMPRYDADKAVHHVTVFCKRQVG
ncbi:Uncharacterised protein [Mycobacteroides abscessus subsp. massiliense]|nr:Uncharacterised protein [Mycobacteroides abscessus subsp. massiliense]SKU76294.1 Uncharacterised protein [Mycobacteroides abscessus subsp. massiliense]